MVVCPLFVLSLCCCFASAQGNAHEGNGSALVQSLCNITSFVLADKQAKLAISRATVSDWPFCLFLIGLHLGNQKWGVNGLLTSPCCVSLSVFVIMYLQAHLEPSYYTNSHFQKLLFKSQYVSIGHLLWQCVIHSVQKHHHFFVC